MPYLHNYVGDDYIGHNYIGPQTCSELTPRRARSARKTRKTRPEDRNETCVFADGLFIKLFVKLFIKLFIKLFKAIY